MSATLRQIIFWMFIVVGALLTYKFFAGPQGKTGAQIDQTELEAKINNGELRQLTLKQNETIAVDRDGHEFRTPLVNEVRKALLMNMATEKDANGKPKVDKVEEEPDSSFSWSLLLNWIPMLLIVLIVIFILRQMQSGGRQTKDWSLFGESRAKQVESNDKLPKFRDVAGASDAKIALQELTEFLKNPGKWQAFGGRIPKGCLLVGPPGCGKTLLARAVASEAGVPFFNVSGSDFVEMFVGIGASRVRDVFEKCRKNAPCVLFIDELDAIGRKRGSGIGGGNDEREQTLNQLLVAMDGFESNPGVIVLAATNRPDVLDKALIRPGRFDRQIRVPLPNAEERLDILHIHTLEKPLSDDVDLGVIAQQTPGYSGADLMNLANEAALQAIRRYSKTPATENPPSTLPPIRDLSHRDADSQRGRRSEKVLTMQDFDQALELVRSGREIFSSLDLVLIESATQLSEPMEKLFVRLFLADRQTVEGELLWADSSYIKYRSSTEGHEIIVPKASIWKFELLDPDLSYVGSY